MIAKPVPTPVSDRRKGGLLDLIEVCGHRLCHDATIQTLFVFGATSDVVFLQGAFFEGGGDDFDGKGGSQEQALSVVGQFPTSRQVQLARIIRGGFDTIGRAPGHLVALNAKLNLLGMIATTVFVDACALLQSGLCPVGGDFVQKQAVGLKFVQLQSKANGVLGQTLYGQKIRRSNRRSQTRTL